MNAVESPLVARLVTGMRPRRNVTLLRMPEPTMPMLRPRTTRIFAEELRRIERAERDVETLKMFLRMRQVA